MYEDRSVSHYFNYILLYYWCCSVGFPVDFALNSNEFQGLGASDTTRAAGLHLMQCLVIIVTQTNQTIAMNAPVHEWRRWGLPGNLHLYYSHTGEFNTTQSSIYHIEWKAPLFFSLDIMKSSSVYTQLGNRKVCDSLRADSTVCVSITKCSNMSGCYQPLFINGVHSTNTQIWSN